MSNQTAKFNDLSERQTELVILIVKEYIKYAVPVSSFSLKENYGLKYSSATIRNDMVILEKKGYIEKSYSSSGRIPTNKGYKFYIQNLNVDEEINQNIKNKINQLFLNRNKDINSLIEEVVKIISLATNTLTVTKNITDESVYIKDLKFYQIDENKALVIVIDSGGRFSNKEINFDEYQLSQLSHAFKVIAERLKGTKISELNEKMEHLIKLLSIELKGFEENFKKFIYELITKLNSTVERPYGLGNIVKFESYQQKEQIAKIFKLIEDNSIWDLIAKTNHIFNKDTEIFIDLEKENLNEIAIINKSFKIKDSRKEIAFIGAKNQDYESMIDLLEFLENKLKE